uniref:BZIP domain-containing protein n=1 Tax=Leptocylindrus danicus TaxID=163516 RepID=A0A7S2P3L7_9STRA|eukprot:CAMPEP_0116021062 /NCGR_PEP_ID=MMETSP0321-20121206/10163_1 /TAXON_ID=163516 /ORGANISM="Leptocylindrus danicus var. danicus, Strain B650" /LENGTH=619 /DNA_ID=CAMNT_0003491861 /DNA_START=54 /DNA_END=1913 /DNA_ORIENTATION=+
MTYSPILQNQEQKQQNGTVVVKEEKKSNVNLQNLEITPMISNANATDNATMDSLLSSMPSPPMDTDDTDKQQQQHWPVKINANGNNDEMKPILPLSSSLPTQKFSIGTTSTSGSPTSAAACGMRTSTSSDTLLLGSSPSTRRQRRLERNRESARLSRRRRKQYLEVLEDRVGSLSEQMDAGRREHVKIAVQTLKKLRDRRLQMALEVLAKSSSSQSSQHIPVLESHLRALNGVNSRSCDELRVANEFQKEQLRCLTLPAHSRFLMWLTLQNDEFFRGGRAASERLSAARIGEKMLSGGTDRVPPSGNMWPLFCNEVGLSYDQEEKVRQFQRMMLTKNQTWLDRHSAKAGEMTLFSAHACINGLSETIRQRESRLLDVLSIEQRVKFLAWARQRQENIKNLAAASTKPEILEGVSSTKHDAANLVVVDRKLRTLKESLPSAPTIVPGSKLKKLSRRPSFESLASSQKELTPSISTSSFTSAKRSNSSGALRERSASIVSFEPMQIDQAPAIPPITPEEAQAAANQAIVDTLGVDRIIPKPAVMPINVVSLDIDPIPVYNPNSISAASPVEQTISMNAVPENSSAGAGVEDIFFNFSEEDWAIGGFDIENTDTDMNNPLRA